MVTQVRNGWGYDADGVWHPQEVNLEHSAVGGVVFALPISGVMWFVIWHLACWMWRTW